MRGAKVPVTLLAPGTRTRDAEGRWTALGDPTVVHAHVAASQAGYSSRSTVDRHVDSGIVLLPAGTTVTTEDLIEVAGAVGVDDGTYRVEHVTRTAKHLRVLVRRHEAGGS